MTDLERLIQARSSSEFKRLATQLLAKAKEEGRNEVAEKVKMHKIDVFLTRTVRYEVEAENIDLAFEKCEHTVKLLNKIGG